MKTLLFLPIILLLFCCSLTYAQDRNFLSVDTLSPVPVKAITPSDYKPGEVIVKFRNGELDDTEMEKEILEVDLKAIKKTALRNFINEKNGFRLRKQWPGLKPGTKKSIARNQVEVRYVRYSQSYVVTSTINS